MVSAETEQPPSAEAGVGTRSSSSGTVSILSRHSEGSLVAAGTVSPVFEAAAAATFAAAIFPACAAPPRHFRSRHIPGLRGQHSHQTASHQTKEKLLHHSPPLSAFPVRPRTV